MDLERGGQSPVAGAIDKINRDNFERLIGLFRGD